MLGLIDSEILYVSAEGRMGMYGVDGFVTDWRYDAEHNEWFDVDRPIAPTENEGTMADSPIVPDDDPIGGSE